MNTTKRKALEQPDPGPGTPKKKSVRQRAAVACEECRARKRRCDGATPACGGCVKRMSTCIYASEIQAREWRESMIQSLRSRLDDLEKEEDEPLGSHGHISRNEPSTSGSTRPPSPSGDGTRAQDVQPSRPNKTGPPISRDQESGFGNADVQRNIGNPPTLRGEEGYSARGLDPCSVEMLMKPIDRAIDSRTAHKDAAGTSNGPVNLTVNEPLRTGVRSCSCDHLLSSSRWRLPLRRHSDKLVALYFARVHRMYAILHERTFRRQYECLWQPTVRTNGILASDCPGLCKQKSKGKTFPAMVYSVFALASLFESGTPEENTKRAEGYFQLAQEIDLLAILDYEVGIELVQLGLLMGFYLQSTERFSKCWNVTGLTIRMAQNMGLQLSLSEARRKALFGPNATQLDCEMRVRVWYGCVLLDREISMSFGRPLMIATGDEAARLPDAIDDHRLAEEMGSWNVQPTGVPSLLESYIQTIKLYDILKQVLARLELKDISELCLDIRSLLSLDTLIMEWKDALPPYLQYDPGSEDTTRSTESQKGNGAVADFSAQAKRLYSRFLHVRVLILRPALDLLFQKQQHNQPSTRTRSMETRVQDLTLSDIAAQCALSAQSLVKLLHTQIQTRSFIAWWYNISYLHTCGSTLLMAMLCAFNDDAVSSGFPKIWELCLEGISRYTGVSSIARKSFRLLNESAKCLLSDNLARKPAPPPRAEGGLSQETYNVGNDLPPLNDSAEGIDPQEWQFPQARGRSEPQPAVDLMLDGDGLRLDGLNSDSWANDAGDSSYWPFMPFLSQLETFDFSTSNDAYGL